MKLTGKIMILFILITIIPITALGLVAMKNLENIMIVAQGNSNQIAEIALEGSMAQLEVLGEKIIRQKAEDVANQVNIYLKDNPTLSVEDLQVDKRFKEIAVQGVGNTGYTALTDVSTLICRFHSNPTIVDMDLKELSEKLPDFWGIMANSAGGRTSEGYYDWQDSDGIVRPKYMYIAISNQTTSDGVRFSIAATTYIDEFSRPIIDTQKKIENSYKDIIAEFNGSLIKVREDSLKFLVVFMVVVIIIGFFLARSITRPLKKLTKVAEEITSGKLNTEMPVFPGKDEISELGDAMNLLVGAVKYHKKKTTMPIISTPKDLEEKKPGPLADLQDKILDDVTNEMDRLRQRLHDEVSKKKF